MKIYAILFVIGVTGLFVGCDEAETPPSYIEFDKVSIVENISAPTNIGSVRHTIPSAYVTIKDEASTEPTNDLGFQNIPAIFPYLGEGLSTLTIRPAVSINGSSTSILEYPFFEPMVLEGYDLTALETHTISIETRYKGVDKIELLFNEDFEANTSIFRDYAETSMEGLFVNQMNDVYEGTQSGHIHLDADNPVVNVATTNFFQLDANQPFLELDYKTDTAIEIGVVATNGSTIEVQALGGVFGQAAPQWKKGYFQLRDLVSSFETRGFTNFQIYFTVILQGGQETGDIYLDNVKLLKQR